MGIKQYHVIVHGPRSIKTVVRTRKTALEVAWIYHALYSRCDITVLNNTGGVSQDV